MRLRAPGLGGTGLVNMWRNQSKVGLRTNGPEIVDKQEKFWVKLIDSKDMRFWDIIAENENVHSVSTVETWNMVGFGGFTDISLENRNAEISLIIDPELRGKGYGEKAVDLLLDQAFNYMNLHCIYGEVYGCNQAGVEFWEKIVKKYKGEFVILRDRKFWNGHYSDSLYFTIWGDEWTVANAV